jgi:hypothetical protein
VGRQVGGEQVVEFRQFASRVEIGASQPRVVGLITRGRLVARGETSRMS